jgi:simple sugar transport system permease protein
MTNGRGWIILALTIFASWDPRTAILGAWIFGGVEALQYRLQPLGISPSLLSMLPFITTIVILVISGKFGQKMQALPKALGKPFHRGER